MQLRYSLRGTLWISVYLLFILAPLLALLTGALPPSARFLDRVLGRARLPGLAMMGLQFGLTARFRYVTEPWGEDVIYHFHRRVSLLAVSLVVVHPLDPARDRLARRWRCPIRCRGAAGRGLRGAVARRAGRCWW